VPYLVYILGIMASMIDAPSTGEGCAENRPGERLVEKRKRPSSEPSIADLLSGEDVEPVYSNLFKKFDDEQQQWLVHTMQKD